MAKEFTDKASFFVDIKTLYRGLDVSMGDLLAVASADGLTLEEAFYLYIAAQNWANGDEFWHVLGDNDTEKIDLVKEALEMQKQK